MTQTQHDNAHEAPPAAVRRDPDLDERAQQIADVTRQLAQKFGRRGEPLGPTRTLRNLDTVIKRDPFFRRRLAFNGLSEAVEWDGRRMRDEDITWIRLAIARTYGVEFGLEATHAVILETARQLTYHPVARYLKRLLWDREPRIDMFLTTHLGVEDTPLTRTISRRWFVSCVARAMGKGQTPVKVDTVLILAGPQGAKKSTAFRVLASDPWFSDTPLDLKHGAREAYQSIRGIWLYELAELASTRPRDAETVKAFLSAPTDRYRPPYGRTVVESHRQCIFVGTTNEAQFLSDSTGARRFLPVSVGKIDIDQIQEDRSQLWAEAVAAHADGEPWWLNAAEDEQLAEAQEQYAHVDPWVVVIDRWLVSPENQEQARRGVQAGEVLTQAIGMDADRQRKGDEMRLGAVLQSMGWAKKRTRRGDRVLRLWSPGD